MTFIESIQSVFSKYATFSGRASRSEYWYFMLFNFALGMTVNILPFLASFFLGFCLGLTGQTDMLWTFQPHIENFKVVLAVILGIYQLAAIIPCLAVGARRLHDMGKSGWWQFLHLAFGVGTIVLVVWWATKSEEKTNAYGEMVA